MSRRMWRWIKQSPYSPRTQGLGEWQSFARHLCYWGCRVELRERAPAQSGRRTVRLGGGVQRGDTGVEPWRTDRSLRGKGGVWTPQVTVRAGQALTQAQFSPLYLWEDVRKMWKRISDPQVGKDLPRSSRPITLFAGAWTSKAFSKGSSCLLTQHPFEDETVYSNTPWLAKRVAIKF